MNGYILTVYGTLVRREVGRFMRIWTQTLLPPVITQTLYFLIFGTLIGSQIADIGGVSYMAFIVPGLVMMGVINSAFSNVVSSFFGAKFQRNLEEMLVSPMPPWVMIAGFVTGGILRGLLVGIIIFLVSAIFTAPTVHNLGMILIFIILTSTVFSLGGLINGIFAKKFDDVGFFTTFILTPLMYLGGVFYSIKDLPIFWQNLSKINPILYMIDGFRYGFYGYSDINPLLSMALLILMTVVLILLANYLIRKGVGLKN